MLSSSNTSELYIVTINSTVSVEDIYVTAFLSGTVSQSGGLPDKGDSDTAARGLHSTEQAEETTGKRGKRGWIKSLLDFFLQDTQVTFWSEGESSVKISPYFSFRPGVNHQFIVANRKLLLASFSVIGRMDAGIHLILTTSTKVQVAFTKQVLSKYLGRFPIIVGDIIIPVKVYWTVEGSLSLEYSKAEYITMGASFSDVVEVGVQWTRASGFSVVRTNNLVWNYVPPGNVSSCSATTSFSLSSRIEFSLYKGRLAFSLGPELALNFASQFPPPVGGECECLIGGHNQKQRTLGTKLAGTLGAQFLIFGSSWYFLPTSTTD